MGRAVPTVDSPLPREMNMTKKIVTLAGDGISPEIMTAGLEVPRSRCSQIGFTNHIVRR